MGLSLTGGKTGPEEGPASNGDRNTNQEAEQGLGEE